MHNGAVAVMQKENRLRRHTDVRVTFGAIVIEHELIERGQDHAEIVAAFIVAFADLRLGNIVASVAHARAHPCNVKLHARQPAVPHSHAKSGFMGPHEEARNRRASQSGLKVKALSFGDRRLEPLFADAPRRGVGFLATQRGVIGEQEPRFDIRVIERDLVGRELRSADTAFARAVGPCKDRDGRNQALSPAWRLRPPRGLAHRALR